MKDICVWHCSSERKQVHSFFLTNHRHAETLTRRKPGVCKKWDEEKERWQIELATDEIVCTRKNPGFPAGIATMYTSEST